MEKHIQIALENAKAALAFIDPWARVVAVQDNVKYQAVLSQLCLKYGFTDEDVITVDHSDVVCYVDLRLVVSQEEDDFYACYEYLPEFDLVTPRKYNEEYNQYHVLIVLHERSIHACARRENRQTPYTVDSINERRTKQMIQQRIDRLNELDAPAIIKLYEELKFRADEYMVAVC